MKLYDGELSTPWRTLSIVQLFACTWSFHSNKCKHSGVVSQGGLPSANKPGPVNILMFLPLSTGSMQRCIHVRSSIVWRPLLNSTRFSVFQSQYCIDGGWICKPDNTIIIKVPRENQVELGLHTVLLYTASVLLWFRIISHSLKVFPLYDGEKECRGYTLFSHLITMGKNSVGYIFKFPPYWMVGKKSGGYTLSLHLYGGVKQWGVHIFSPSVWWGERVGGTLFLPICTVEER